MRQGGGQFAQCTHPTHLLQLCLNATQSFTLFVSPPALDHVLQGNRCLRSKQLEHRDPVRSEDLGSQIIFEVQHTDKFCLVDQWQTENRTRMALVDVRVGGKRTVCHSIVKNHVLPGPGHKVEDRFRQVAQSCFVWAHNYAIAADSSFCFDSLFVASLKNQ